MLDDFRGAANSPHVLVARVQPLACKRSKQPLSAPAKRGGVHEPLVYFASASFRAVTLPRSCTAVVAKLDSWWFQQKIPLSLSLTGQNAHELLFLSRPAIYSRWPTFLHGPSRYLPFTLYLCFYLRSQPFHFSSLLQPPPFVLFFVQ